MPAEEEFMCVHSVCMMLSTAWTFLFGSALTTGGGSPIKRNGSFKVVPLEQPFSVTLPFEACLTELLLLVEAASSLLVLLLSSFVLSKWRSSFLTVTPWCSETVRHTGGTDGKQEFPALNWGNRRKMSKVSVYKIPDGTHNIGNVWLC